MSYSLALLPFERMDNQLQNLPALTYKWCLKSLATVRIKAIQLQQYQEILS